MLAIVALDLDSEECKSKLKKIQTTHGSKSKKQSIQLKVREHNLPIEETKAKVLEGKKRFCCGYFGSSMDSLMNGDWRATHRMAGKQDAFGFV